MIRGLGQVVTKVAGGAKGVARIGRVTSEPDLVREAGDGTSSEGECG